MIYILYSMYFVKYVKDAYVCNLLELYIIFHKKNFINNNLILRVL